MSTRLNTKEPHLSAAGVMKFEAGHPILDEFVLELSSTFDGLDWGSNGPKLVTRDTNTAKLFLPGNTE